MAKPKAPRIPDADARATALDPRRSFIVQAPAGSGKTELLVRRFLSLLAGAKRPESVLAITFTRKAAAEMRERVVSALKEGRLADPDVPAHELERIELARRVIERSEAQGWDLLDNAGRLQISTIDSLCARLTAATPLLSRLGSTPQIVENAQPYFREAARRVLVRAGQDSELGRAAAGMLARQEVRGNKVEQQIIDMLRRRDQWLGGVLDSNADPDSAIDRFEQALAEMMGTQLGSISGLVGNKLMRGCESIAQMTYAVLSDAGEAEAWKWPTLGAGGELSGELAARDAWVEVATLLLTGSGGWRAAGGLKAALGVPPQDKKTKQPSAEKVAFVELVEAATRRDEESAGELLAALIALRLLPAKPKFGDDTRQALRDLFVVMRDASAQLWLVFREAGAVDFIEVASRAVGALVDQAAPTDLLQKLDASVDHVLVDEFQDTSRSQVALIRSLLSGWDADSGQTLFLVGDPMQSIYRFRKAEVGLFLHAADTQAEDALFDHVRLESLKLTVNFRSTPQIVSWVNDTFNVVMGEHNDVDSGCVAYSQSVAAPGKPSGPQPETVVWEVAEDQKPDAAEAEGLAEMIETELVPAASERGGTVAVLVHKRAVATLITQALRNRGIRYRGEGMEFLDKRTAVVDLQSLTRAILSPLDRIGALAVLRSPLVGLGDADLFALVEPGVAAYRASLDGPKQENGRTPVPSIAELLTNEKAVSVLSEDGRGRVEAWCKVWADARAQLGRRPLDIVVRSAWLRLGGPQTLEPTGPADSERFFLLLVELEKAGSLDLGELSERLANLEAVSDPSPGINVEFMTIHKSKGLEFDTVVLPALVRGGGGGGGQADVLAFETSSYTGELVCCAPSAERGRKDSDDAAYKYLEAREKRRGDAEALRLLYVASTRAKTRLVLSTADDFTKDGQPEKRSRLYSLWAAVESQFSADAARRKAVGISASDESPERFRVSRDWLKNPAADAPKLPRLQIVQVMRPSETADLEPHEAAVDPEWTASRISRAVGLVVHEYFERFTGEEPKAWSEARLRSAEERARMERGLLNHGALPGELTAGLADIVEALVSTLADNESNWIFDRHEDAHDEWRVTSYAPDKNSAEGSEVRQPVIGYAAIDRTFRKDGVRWIIDYKTDRCLGEGGVERVAALRFEHHRRQLTSYAGMLAQAEPETPIRIAIYFPLIDGAPRLYVDDYQAD